jgi:transglutaminase-like putative cysteine protease
VVHRLDESDAMGNRWSWLAGAAGITLAVLRLGRLLKPTVEGAPWQVAVVAGAAMGAIITWALRDRWSSIAGNLVAFAIVSMRIAVPGTLAAGLIPTSRTVPAFRAELGLGVDLIRFGVAPVSPVAGLVVILTAVGWGLAALMAWAIRKRQPALALAPPLLFYLQLAVIDQTPGGAPWTVAFLSLVALSLGAVAQSRRTASTAQMRAADPVRPPYVYPTIFVAVSVVLALGGMRLASSVIPPAGLVDWRSHTSIGGGILVGVSYNLFTSIQQQLLSPTDAPVFTATVDGDVDPSSLYWELITLEQFDGKNWIPMPRETRSPSADTWEDPETTFFGPTAPVDASIRIAALRQNYLPVLYSPTWLGSDSALFNDSFGVRTDGSVQFDLLSWDGLTYQEAALVPNPDLNALASSGGILTPIFQEAADSQAFTGHAVPTPATRRPASISDDLELPTLDPIIRTEARALTADGTSAFEKALLLEAWFRDPANFTYSTKVDPGHTSKDLADWLFTTDSPSYRTGYCEQFATAMAVMARSIGIPARVVTGFAPGEVQPDGTIIVRDRNAHAWVELWMNNQGWVRFDPTPRAAGDNPSTASLVGFDPRDYVPPPADATSGADSGATPTQRSFNPDFGERQLVSEGSSGDTTQTQNRIVTPGRVIAVVIVVLASIVPLAKAVRRRRRLARAITGDVSGLWDEIVDRLRDLGTGPSPSSTPLEVAVSVHSSLRPLAAGVTRTTFAATSRLDTKALVDATSSFDQAESYLRTVHPTGDRIRARMRLRSLWRRRRTA